MKVMTATSEILCVGSDIDPLTLVEKVARTCYKSEDKIALGTAPKMISALIKRGHYAMLEHASYIFNLQAEVYEDFLRICTILEDAGHHLFLIKTNKNTHHIVSGNVRAWRDFIEALYTEKEMIPQWLFDFVHHNRLDVHTFFGDMVHTCDLIAERLGITRYAQNVDALEISPEELSAEDKWEHLRITVKFYCDRGISHEIVRHRVASFAQESTRYCNYSKDKFDNDITYIDIQPTFGQDKRTKNMSSQVYLNIIEEWQHACMDAERHYMRLIELGCPAEYARSVLNNSTKTEICVTMNIKNWRHFFSLRACRATGPAHPQMEEITRQLLTNLKIELPDYFRDMEWYVYD